MNFIEELRWRNMFHQSTEGAEAHLNTGMRTGYIGFDPTAPALGIGNYVQIMILTLFQRAGHRPIVLMGGATGRVGDPSGKDKERELKTLDELDGNLNRQKEHMMRLLEFGDKGNQAILRNNLDFYKNMDVLTFLRDVGKTLTVNYMLSKDSVQNRLESGLSFTEFSYQLLQAYDFQCLYKEHGCSLQMGGSDQWGNITSGTEFIRRNLSEKAHAITTPLLTKSDGKKFGKSEDGNIWLDPDHTSPYKFYQFWINSDDKDLPKLTRYFTLKTREEVEALEAEYANNPVALKRILAEELTVRIHSEPVYKAVLNVSELLFNNRAGKETLFELGEKDLATVAGEIPSFEVPKSVLSNGVGIIELMSEVTNMLPSKAEAKRAIQGQAVSVNKEKITSLDTVINHESLLHGKYIMLENGKKNKVMLVVN
ncbi:MAG: tyrosine--tRNA ligase [Saprospiraceae bacterium]|nr:tyrosine--tRNA ligase [Saprospiraceae bacterium]MCF8248415.1 tyrosine--tRNA ligase [Saprospiraceae bacterium]MCF8280086.1 tyrosine--tRNA ligase [Bacteroidales bacterium]MCF8309943.1 tyrosine--tRNA ligase [Saprospiraceae bacterium]MCF8438726.1 tyrosine--tRNA ligase [Saprospiraceae bacterium]